MARPSLTAMSLSPNTGYAPDQGVSRQSEFPFVPPPTPLLTRGNATGVLGGLPGIRPSCAIRARWSVDHAIEATAGGGVLVFALSMALLISSANARSRSAVACW